MGLGVLVLGLVVFLGTHVFVSFRGARAGVIARVGLHAYRGAFAVVALIGHTRTAAGLRVSARLTCSVFSLKG